MIVIEHLEINQIFALSNPLRVEIPFNKYIKLNINSLDYHQTFTNESYFGIK